MRHLAFLTMAVALASPVWAQTTNAPVTAAQSPDSAWSGSVEVDTYVLSGGRYYVQPEVAVNRHWLHLEARYNYEDLDTGSAWMGVNFSGGRKLTWELTPMLGGVFGRTAGLAPGLEGTVKWRTLEVYGEAEYVLEPNGRSNSFFYNWTEVTLAPTDWFRFGVTTQRTRVYQSERQIQRGLMAALTYKRVDVTGYLYNPDMDTRFVLAAVLSF